MNNSTNGREIMIPLPFQIHRHGGIITILLAPRSNFEHRCLRASPARDYCALVTIGRERMRVHIQPDTWTDA